MAEATTQTTATEPPKDEITQGWIRFAFAGLVFAAAIYGLKKMEDEDRAREEEEDDEGEN